MKVPEIIVRLITEQPWSDVQEARIEALMETLDENGRHGREAERRAMEWQHKAEVIAENAASYQEEIRVLKQRIAGLEAELARERKCQGDH